MEESEQSTIVSPSTDWRSPDRKINPLITSIPEIHAYKNINVKETVIMKTGFHHQLLFTQALNTPHSRPCMVLQLRFHQSVKTA